MCRREVSPMADTPEKSSLPTAADIHREQKQLEHLTVALARQMKLRQWAVEQAVKIAGHPNFHGDIKELAHFFYDFVIKNDSGTETKTE